MQFVDQETLSLISPMHVASGARMNYYALSPISEGDILYTVGPTGTTLWKAGRTDCSKLRRGIMIAGTPAKPKIARYLVRTYLQEIGPGPERDKLLHDLVALDALPY